MAATVNEACKDILFRHARTHNAWREGEVTDEALTGLYDLAKMGPTSANCSPMRVLFLRSAEAKARLKPCLDAGNVKKTMAAPVTAVIAYDTKFYDLLPKLFPHADARSWFAHDAEKAAVTAFRNGTLQGAYFIIAARAMGLDCGPMSGFDNAKLDAEFFPDGRYKSNFLCNIGFGDGSVLRDRAPRLSFAEACEIL